jgi:hypothetical protein
MNHPPSSAAPAAEFVTEDDIARAARLMIKERGRYAGLHSLRRAEDLRLSGNFEAEAIWRRIVQAIERLQRTPLPDQGRLADSV